MSLSIDVGEAERFMRPWFAQIEHEYIELRTFAGPEQHFFRSVDEALGWLETHKSIAEPVYYGVHPRLRRGGTNEDVSRLFGPYSDVDPEDGEVLDTAAIIRKVRSLVPDKLTIFVDSGNGLHVLIAFEKPLPVSEEAVAKFGLLQRRLRDYLDGDPRAIDLARVLRLPGSFNDKMSPPRPCRMLSL